MGVVIPALVLDARTPRSIEPKDVSRREYQWKPAVREGWPNPRDPWVLDLGGGVRMLMTTTCHVDAQGNTLSAAETLLGMVEHYRLGILAGEPTAGCNGNRNVTTLPGGLEVSWTGMKVQKHDGSPHEGVGFQPEILVRPTAQGLAQGQDEVLERALALVQAPPPQP